MLVKKNKKNDNFHLINTKIEFLLWVYLILNSLIILSKLLSLLVCTISHFTYSLTVTITRRVQFWFNTINTTSPRIKIWICTCFDSSCIFVFLWYCCPLCHLIWHTAQHYPSEIKTKFSWKMVISFTWCTNVHKFLGFASWYLS